MIVPRDKNLNSLVKVFVCACAQLCPTLWDPTTDWSPPGSSVHGILQARTLQWAAISSSRGSPQPRDWSQVSGNAGIFFTVWATREAQWWWFQSTLYMVDFFWGETEGGRPCSLQDCSSWTQDWTKALDSESAESWPLDCEEIPSCFSYIHRNYSLNLVGLTNPSALSTWKWLRFWASGLANNKSIFSGLSVCSWGNTGSQNHRAVFSRDRNLHATVYFNGSCWNYRASQAAVAVKNPPVSAGDRRDSGSIAGSRRIPGGGHGHALQRSCLEKPWKKRAWRVLGHWVAKSRTQLKQLSRHARWNFLGVCFSLRVNWLMSVFHKHVLFFSISCLGSLVSRGSI